MIVKVQRRDKYGRILIYPMNDMADLFTRISGRKTLMLEDIGLIELLGFTIEWIPMTVEVPSARQG